MVRSLAWFVVALVPSAAFAGDPRDPAFFESKIRPILVDSCFKCHGGAKTSGKLRVDSREALVKGGENGPAVELDDPAGSRLLAAVRRVDGVAAMPPDKPLRPDQVADLEAWIKAGAPWPAKTSRFESRTHWSFLPVADPPVPKVRNPELCENEIDRFLLAKAEADGTSLGPDADRSALIRRVTFDLTGLPPTPREIETFLNDRSEDVWGRLVDRLLASPRYGEKTGRLWLDVVRYADTAGENSDHPLPHVWRYRNWVVDSFNRDRPFDRMIRDQIAGDLVEGEEDYSDRVVATGYLALARRFGHDIDKDMHLTHEDVIDNLGKAFLGLTLACARCHDHKYDPITAKDYYALYGVFDSTKFAFPGCEPKQQPRDLVPLVHPKRFEAGVKPFRDRLKVLDDIRATNEREIETIAKSIGEEIRKDLGVLASGKVEDGKSADLATGAKVDLERVAVRRGETLLLSIHPNGNHGADSTRVDLTIAETAKGGGRWGTYELVDGLESGNPNAGRWFFADARSGLELLGEKQGAVDGRPELRAWRSGDTPSVFVNSASQPVKVWTTLPARSFFMHPGPKGPVALGWTAPRDVVVSIRGTVADAHPGGDGVGFGLELIRRTDLAGKLTSLRDSRAAMGNDDAERRELLGKLAMPTAYGVSEGTPRDAAVHKRGEPSNPGEVVRRRAPTILGGAPLGDSGRSGRKELADVLTAPGNPLTARVIVNRVWRRHFGRGLVETPNDFGVRGAAPSHPELLDHLATEFVRDGWSVKRLSRRIVTSRAYRLASVGRRRLSAEELRDTLLFVSGELDEAPGGPHPFPAESTWSFTQHGPFAAEYPTNKRSVYMLQKRNRRDRFLALFDGPDPNASVAARDETTVPTQALYFMNDPTVHRAADAFAGRVLSERTSTRDRTAFAYLTLYGREPDAEDLRDAEAYLAGFVAPETSAWRSFVRVLMSGNEFLFVD